MKETNKKQNDIECLHVLLCRPFWNQFAMHKVYISIQLLPLKLLFIYLLYG